MSEYQYYEFHAIDRSLTDRQMKELRAISTRATISRTLFSNHYTYGDLKANPSDLLARYFDASLYFAYWHVVEVAFRFSRSAIDLKTVRRYRAGGSLSIRSVGHDVVITLCAQRDDFDAEDDGRGWLSSLTPLRAELVSGDARALYLAWLLGVQHGEIDERATEPSRLDGLATLSPALEAFVDIMGLNRNLVAAAAEGTSNTSPALLGKALDRWVAQLDEREKVVLLSRVACGQTGVGGELIRRFRRQMSQHAVPQALRTVGALRARAEEFEERQRQAAVAHDAKERARRDRQLAAERDQYLLKLAKRQADAWRRIEALVVTKRPADYDAAITLLQDLYEIGKRTGRGMEVAERVRALRDAHPKKSSFLSRLRKAGL